MEDFTQENLDELRRHAAFMYEIVRECADIGECFEPSGEDKACPPCGCSDCGCYKCELRDSLLRLGVDT